MNLYDLIQEILKHKKRLSANAFTTDAYSKLTVDEDKKAFILLKNISSIHARYERDIVEFSPAYELTDGSRSFSLQDLTDDDYTTLRSFDLSKLPAILSLQIADILWVEKKDYKMALLASKLSYELFVTFFDEEKDWAKCFNYISHSVGLAAKINSKEYNTYLQEVFDKVVKLNGEDSSLLSLLLIDLLVSQKWKDFELILPILDTIIANSDVNKVKRAFELKTKIYFKQNDPQSAMENNKELAKYLENMAKLEKDDEIPGLFKAEKFLQEAVHLYRNNGAPEAAKQTHVLLLQIQKRIPQYMIPINIHTDTTQPLSYVKSLFEGLSFQEKIIRLIQCTNLYTKDYLKQKVLTDAADPISCLFSSGIKGAKGQTIAELPSIDIENPEVDTDVLEKHMHHQAKIMEDICGNTVLKWAMDVINSNGEITEERLRFIVVDNPIIPAGRERILLSGLYHGLKGDLYLSLHILAPQIENLFRQIAEDAGAIVSTLKDDDTSDAKLFTSVFKLPELIDCYDNDILFMFQGLMNEKVGANIRNEIAHGLMGEGKGNSGAARFFFCWVLKLLSFTSRECCRIMLESQNLQLQSNDTDYSE